MAPGFSGQIFSDNNLINGRMNFDCDAAADQAEGENNDDDHNNTENKNKNDEDNTKDRRRAKTTTTATCTENAGLSKFRFEPGKAHRLRFINSGSQGVERISLDGHMMTVMAQDFVEVEPYDTPVVTIGIGQRVDVVVQARAVQAESNTYNTDDTNLHPPPRSKSNSRSTPAFWLRANLTSCSLAKQHHALAAVYYIQTDTKSDIEADTNAMPDSEPWDVPDPGTCANDPLELTRPYYPIALPEPSWTQHMDIGTYRNASGNLLWTFGVSQLVLSFLRPFRLRRTWFLFLDMRKYRCIPSCLAFEVFPPVYLPTLPVCLYCNSHVCYATTTGKLREGKLQRPIPSSGVKGRYRVRPYKQRL